MNQYIIVGDTDKNKECLVCICGSNEDKAKERLTQMLTNPSDSDKHIMAGHSNLRVMEVKREDCWWLNGCD